MHFIISSEAKTRCQNYHRLVTLIHCVAGQLYRTAFPTHSANTGRKQQRTHHSADSLQSERLVHSTSCSPASGMDHIQLHGDCRLWSLYPTSASTVELHFIRSILLSF